MTILTSMPKPTRTQYYTLTEFARRPAFWRGGNAYAFSGDSNWTINPRTITVLQREGWIAGDGIRLDITDAGQDAIRWYEGRS